MQILTSDPRSCTGRMLTDEQVLTERGDADGSGGVAAGGAVTVAGERFSQCPGR
jgi:hypothetical protein